MVTEGLGLCPVIKPEDPGVEGGERGRSMEELSETLARVSGGQQDTEAGKTEEPAGP